MVKTLFPLVDYVIVDAFGAAHRAHASIVGWPKMLAGPITDKELKALKKIIDVPDKPMAMLIGGAKAIKAIKQAEAEGVLLDQLPEGIKLTRRG